MKPSGRFLLDSGNQYEIRRIGSDTVMADAGPMRLTIQAWKNREPVLKLLTEAARQSFHYLERIAGFQKILSLKYSRISSPTGDAIADKMIQSVRCIGDEDLTPMAAVAGTIADAVADWLFERGMTRVIVNNGGDIAVRNSGDIPVRAGVRTDINNPAHSVILTLNTGSPSWGITTSGLGGRSFTRGIASAVTVVAENASVADAASTAIANACFIQDDAIIQRPAEYIDPETDLKGVPVTVKTGKLSPEKISLAIQTALKKAETITVRGFIIGALIAAGQQTAMTHAMADLNEQFPKPVVLVKKLI